MERERERDFLTKGNLCSFINVLEWSKRLIRQLDMDKLNNFDPYPHYTSPLMTLSVGWV